MKKLTFFAMLAAAATTAALSCSKDNDAPSFAGKPVSVEVGGPEVEQLATASRVAMTGTNPYTFEWEAGDAFCVYNYTDNVKANVNCGEFTTVSGGAPASFTGTIPASATYEKFVALRSYSNSFTVTSSTSAKSFKFNIPAEQDGTGVKYCLVGTKSVSYSDGTMTITKMQIQNPLTRFDVPAAADVRRITVSIDHSISHTFGLCSEGNSLDATANIYDTKDFALSGAANNTITIYNDGALLSGPVYFASRHTMGSDAYGYGTLTFVFTNGSGKTATKKVVLAKDIDGDTAGTYYTLKGRALNYLGAVPLTESDFE